LIDYYSFLIVLTWKRVWGVGCGV